MKDALEGIAAVFANLFAWMAHSEQIWFPLVSTYVRHISEAFGLPDLRGPFIFLTLVYAGLRFGDLLDKRESIDENL